MDQNGSLPEIETCKPKKSTKYNIVIKKTLQFLVPVSLLSFFLTYVSCFPFIFTYNFHFSTLLFPLFSRALERKYMFLICNGILAFLAKTLSFNSSSPSVEDFTHEEPTKCTKDSVKPALETSLIEEVVPFEETRLSVQYSTAASKNVAVEREEEEKQGKEEEEEEVSFTNSKSRCAEAKALGQGKEGKFQTGSSLIIESVDIYSEDEQDDDDEIEESGSLLEALAAEQGNEVNLNTEELNQKFEEFIRKMKEEIRIGAQQQLLVA